jgi:hypothetical protein
LEKKLCVAEGLKIMYKVLWFRSFYWIAIYYFIDSAQLRVGEGVERGNEDTAGLLRKQKDSFDHQLEMVAHLIQIFMWNNFDD